MDENDKNTLYDKSSKISVQQNLIKVGMEKLKRMFNKLEQTR